MLDTRIRKHEKTSPDDENYNYLCFYNDDALEASKRINAYDDLTRSLKDMVEIVGSNFCSNKDIKLSYRNARELLERLK